MSFDAVAHNLANLALAQTRGLQADVTPSGANQRWPRKNGLRKIVFIGDSVTDRFATAAPFYTQLDGHSVPGGALEGVTFVDMGSNGLTGSGWLAGGGRLNDNPITNITLAGGVASITYSTTGTAPNILYLLRPGDQVRITGVNGITGLPALATVIANAGASSSYTATIAAPNASGTFSATGAPKITVSGLLADLPTDADLYCPRFGINDVRTGAVTLAQLTQIIIDGVDAIYARANASAQVVLLVPNTLTTDDYLTNGYVTLTGQWAGMTMAQAGQAASTMMRDAYYAAWAARPRCGLNDLQSEIYGKTALPRLVVTGSNPNVLPLMNDQLHPTATARILEADFLASLLDVRTDRGPTSNQGRSYSYSASRAAHTENFGFPQTRYPMALMDERYWTVVEIGRVGAVGATSADVGGTAPDFIPRGVYVTNIAAGDIITVGNQAMPTTVSTINNGGTFRLLPTTSWAAQAAVVNIPSVGDIVRHHRPKFARSVKARQAAADPANGWQRYGVVAAIAGDSSYIDVRAYPGEPAASTWALTASDLCFTQSEAQSISLTGATIAPNGNDLRITKTAAYFFPINARPIAFMGAAR